jgi:hypothetical protein
MHGSIGLGLYKPYDSWFRAIKSAALHIPQTSEIVSVRRSRCLREYRLPEKEMVTRAPGTNFRGSLEKHILAWKITFFCRPGSGFTTCECSESNIVSAEMFLC